MFVSLQPVRACACAKVAWGATVIDHNYRISDEDAFVSPLPALTPGLLAEEKERNWRASVLAACADSATGREVFMPSASCQSHPTQLLHPSSPIVDPLMDRETSRLSVIQRLQVFSPENMAGVI